MTKLQIANVAMLNTVQKVFANNGSVWNTIKPIAAEVADLQILLIELSINTNTQFQTKTVGYTNQKDVGMKLMNDLGYIMSLKLTAWARKTGNEIVLKAVNYSHRFLKSGTETEQLNRNTSIANVAKVQMSKIGDYNINTQKLKAFQAAIVNAKSLSIARNAIGSSRKAATENIGINLMKSLNIITDLDILIKGMVGEENKIFEDTYFAARKIVYARGSAVAKVDKPQSNSSYK